MTAVELAAGVVALLQPLTPACICMRLEFSPFASASDETLERILQIPEEDDTDDTIARVSYRVVSCRVGHLRIDVPRLAAR